MMATNAEVKKISLEELKTRLDVESPMNEDRNKGFALVNVLSPEEFQKEHIDHSINIPKTKVDEFERRFDKAKELIVYCGSSDCSASGKVAEELMKKGFRNVKKFKGGMQEWHEDGAGDKKSAKPSAPAGQFTKKSGDSKDRPGRDM